MISRTLTERLADRIRSEGPITFHDWMQIALYDEHQGYYQRGDLARWGRSGDYRTSPETNVLFAATFARYFAQVFVELGSPANFTVVEIGGGAGQFAAQFLETLRTRFPAVFESVSYVLDEISHDARQRAATEVARFQERVRFEHLRELKEINAGIIFSNELVDSFPVHRIGLREEKLVEFYVGLSERGDFEWIAGPISSPRLLTFLERFQIKLREGQVIEVNLALEDWYREVAAKLDTGYLVTVDYGSEGDELRSLPTRQRGTLRAFQHHRFAENILDSPGEQDITSSINWTVMKEIGSDLGFELVAFERQDRFLLNGGLLKELESKAAEARTEAEKMQLRTSAREMILPGGMASSFQVLLQRKL